MTTILTKILAVAAFCGQPQLGGYTKAEVNQCKARLTQCIYGKVTETALTSCFIEETKK